MLSSFKSYDKRLTALAVSRRSKGDLDGAIEEFSFAIQNVDQERQVLQSGESLIKPSSAAMLLFQRGSTYLLKHAGKYQGEEYDSYRGSHAHRYYLKSRAALTVAPARTFSAFEAARF